MGYNPRTLFTKRQNDPPESVDNDASVLPDMLDLSGGNLDRKNDFDSEDNQPPSWKLSKKGSSLSTKASTRTVKPSGARLSPRNLMKKTLKKKRIILRKRGQ